MKRKTITAEVHDSNEKVKLSVPAELYNAPARAEVRTGIKLCGWHRGRTWGVIHVYNIWTRQDGTCYGDEYTAYRLTCDRDREAFERICNEHNPYYYGH